MKKYWPRLNSDKNVKGSNKRNVTSNTVVVSNKWVHHHHHRCCCTATTATTIIPPTTSTTTTVPRIRPLRRHHYLTRTLPVAQSQRDLSPPRQGRLPWPFSDRRPGPLAQLPSTPQIIDHHERGVPFAFPTRLMSSWHHYHHPRRQNRQRRRRLYHPYLSTRRRGGGSSDIR